MINKCKACFNRGQPNKVKHILQMQYIPETARCIEKCLLKGVSRNSFFISLKILNLIFYHICIIFELFACIRERMMAMKILRGVMLGKYIISFLWFWCDGSYSSCVNVWLFGTMVFILFRTLLSALKLYIFLNMNINSKYTWIARVTLKMMMGPLHCNCPPSSSSSLYMLHAVTQSTAHNWKALWHL